MSPITPQHDQSEMLRALWALDTVAQKPDSMRAPQDMRFRIDCIDKLPPLPEIARRVLALREDPYSDAGRLAQVVELDPSLSAQIVRWANSPLYGSRKHILSVKDAIIVVLGFDQVFNQAIALCAMRALQAPREGLLGKRFFWRQTLAGSALIQKLAQHMATENRPALDIAHLVFLLHNTGHLLLAHLFRKEFNYLLKLADANPNAPLLPIERFALGVDHTQLGAWLMQSWNMPEELKTIIQHHHNPYYRGQHEKLVWMTCLTDRLLGQIGIGDAVQTSVDDTPLYDQLGLNPAISEACLAQVENNLDELDLAVANLVDEG
ncbi:HDOD domain-containing protein [Methylococcus sp. EFPC2]|uniref:HDOD domain-containing protein n=1 Tax=Methylococcus sp. EFPC2 TaxID=2812648 RepID=UPI0019674E8B|nr:HDOD domain-containing protein [Methylococcus sp. EFPC2]QSA98380.1 HDOD domain-containing protein [Methylococcus sp. EFPC2]